MRKTKSRGNGEGTIYYSESKKLWVAQYKVGIGADGKIKKKTIYGKKRSDVKNKLDQLVTELKTNKYVDKSDILFKDICLEIIEDGFKFNKLDGGSYVRKMQTYNAICKHYIADKEIQKITEYDVKDFLVYITKYSNSVIGKIYGLINNTFKKAIRKNIITYNFLDDNIEFGKPKSLKQDRKVRAFTVEEQKQFMNILNNKYYNYKYQYLLALFSGLRMGEINALSIDDIDYKNKIISVSHTIAIDDTSQLIRKDYTKTPAGMRQIIIDDQIEFILKDYMNTKYIENKENLLFYDTKKDKYISTSQVNSAFKRLIEKFELLPSEDTNQHMLRHTYATRCIESGMPVNVLSKILGHKDTRTTLEVYCDVFSKYEKQHTDTAYNYLKENQLLIHKENLDNNIPPDDLNKIMEGIKRLYAKKDDKLIKLLKLVS